MTMNARMTAVHRMKWRMDAVMDQRRKGMVAVEDRNLPQSPLRAKMIAADHRTVHGQHGGKVVAEKWIHMAQSLPISCGSRSHRHRGVEMDVAAESDPFHDCYRGARLNETKSDNDAALMLHDYALAMLGHRHV